MTNIEDAQHTSAEKQLEPQDHKAKIEYVNSLIRAPGA